MQSFLDRLGYGNGDISGGIDRFWLMSSLKISAREQVGFLENLSRGGSGPGNPNIGWYVGFLEVKGKRYAFAANLTGPGAQGLKARDVCKKVFKRLSLIR